MLTYLLNVSVIWGISLLVFQWLLKQETFHRWNRIYLLLSLAGGLLIPLVSVPATLTSGPAAAPTMLRPIGELVVMGGTVAQNAATDMPVQARPVSWLWTIYLAGVAIMLFRLLRELAQLAGRYRKGKKIRDAQYTLIETGIDASPYSFFKLIFISSRDHYTSAELEMVLHHELRHVRLYHSLDLLLTRLLQAVCWFHPLIYWYRHSIQLVHEYQADAIARDEPAPYGTFLLEQTLLYRNYTLAHSFFHSPIKNRILMLTKETSVKSRRTKYVLAIPMIAAFLLVCTNRSFSHQKVRNGNKETFKGNVFEYPGGGPEQQDKMKDNKGNEMIVSISVDPVAMNGEKIYGEKAVSKAPTLMGAEPNMVKVVFDKLHDRLNKLDDGEYHMAIFSTIIDKQGNFAYYFVRGIEGPGWDIMQEKPKNMPTVDKELQKEFVQEIESILDNMRFKPAQLNGKAVHATMNNDPFFNQKIIVKNHQAVLTSK